MDQIERELDRLSAEYAAASEGRDRAMLARDLRYWQSRRASARFCNRGNRRGWFGSVFAIQREDGRVQTFRIVGEDVGRSGGGKHIVCVATRPSRHWKGGGRRYFDWGHTRGNHRSLVTKCRTSLTVRLRLRVTEITVGGRHILFSHLDWNREAVPWRSLANAVGGNHEISHDRSARTPCGRSA